MVTVETVGTYYEAGDFAVTQRHKKGEKAHYNRNGVYVTPTGFGNATEVVTSRFILLVKSEDGVTIPVRIDPYFKARGKKLTEKRRTKLEECRPDQVHLEKSISYYGNEYVTVIEEDMFEWCKNAGIE